MATEIQERTKEAVAAIIAQRYYPGEFTQVLAERCMTMQGINGDEYPDKECIYLMHFFWEELPDSPSIRRGPFNAICNIAERIFDFE